LQAVHPVRRSPEVVYLFPHVGGDLPKRLPDVVGTRTSLVRVRDALSVRGDDLVHEPGELLDGRFELVHRVVERHREFVQRGALRARNHSLAEFPVGTSTRDRSVLLGRLLDGRVRVLGRESGLVFVEERLVRVRHRGCDAADAVDSCGVERGFLAVSALLGVRHETVQRTRGSPRDRRPDESGEQCPA
jgi:hypothetical protein